MLVVVQYQDETFDMVIHYRLNELLEAGTILGFSSSSGWVEVDRSSRNPLEHTLRRDAPMRAPSPASRH